MWCNFASQPGQMIPPPSIAADQKLLLLALTLQHWLGAASHALALNGVAPADSAAALTIIFEGARQRQHGTQVNTWPDYQVWLEAASSKLSAMNLSPTDYRTERSLFLRHAYQRQQANQATVPPEMPTQPVLELGQIDQPADQPRQSLPELEQGTQQSEYLPAWDGRKAGPGHSNARICNLSSTDQYDLEDLVLWAHEQVSHQC